MARPRGFGPLDDVTIKSPVTGLANRLSETTVRTTLATLAATIDPARSQRIRIRFIFGPTLVGHPKRVLDSALPGVNGVATVHTGLWTVNHCGSATWLSVGGHMGTVAPSLLVNVVRRGDPRGGGLWPSRLAAGTKPT